MTEGQITNYNFWNGRTMETYINHDFFNTWADNSIDVMDHWTSGLAWWANDLIEDFYDDPFPVDWNVKLVMSI